MDNQVDHNIKEGKRANFLKLAQNYWDIYFQFLQDIQLQSFAT
jgi:hypothetical protein